MIFKIGVFLFCTGCLCTTFWTSSSQWVYTERDYVGSALAVVGVVLLGISLSLP